MTQKTSIYRRVTQPDIVKLQAIMGRLGPDAPFRLIAAQWGRNNVTTSMYVKRLRSGEALHFEQKVILVKGLLRDIFLILDARGLTIGQQAKAIGVAHLSILRWRTGETSPQLFMVECLCQLANKQLTLTASDDSRAEKESN